MGRNTHQIGGRTGEQQQETPMSGDLHFITVSVCCMYWNCRRRSSWGAYALPSPTYRLAHAFLFGCFALRAARRFWCRSRWHCACSGFVPSLYSVILSPIRGCQSGQSNGRWEERIPIAFSQAIPSQSYAQQAGFEMGRGSCGSTLGVHPSYQAHHTIIDRQIEPNEDGF